MKEIGLKKSTHNLGHSSAT